MLFYTTLFLLCVAISALGLWIYRSSEHFWNRIYRRVFPQRQLTAKDARRQRVKRALNGAARTPQVDAKTPWGWAGSDIPAARARPEKPDAKPAVPWGWGGGKAGKRPRGAKTVVKQY